MLQGVRNPVFEHMAFPTKPFYGEAEPCRVSFVMMGLCVAGYLTLRTFWWANKPTGFNGIPNRSLGKNFLSLSYIFPFICSSQFPAFLVDFWARSIFSIPQQFSGEKFWRLCFTEDCFSILPVINFHFSVDAIRAFIPSTKKFFFCLPELLDWFFDLAVTAAAKYKSFWQDALLNRVLSYGPCMLHACPDLSAF